MTAEPVAYALTATYRRGDQDTHHQVPIHPGCVRLDEQVGLPFVWHVVGCGCGHLPTRQETT